MTSPQAIAPETPLNGGKLARVKRASFTRKVNATRLIFNPKPLQLPPDFREVILEQLSVNMALLRFNIKFVVNKRGSNVTSFCRDLKSAGIFVSRFGIVTGGRKRSVQLTYVTTMALALRVPTWVMIHPDIASVWDSLNLD